MAGYLFEGVFQVCSVSRKIVRSANESADPSTLSKCFGQGKRHSVIGNLRQAGRDCTRNNVVQAGRSFPGSDPPRVELGYAYVEAFIKEFIKSK